MLMLSPRMLIAMCLCSYFKHVKHNASLQQSSVKWIMVVVTFFGKGPSLIAASASLRLHCWTAAASPTTATASQLMPRLSGRGKWVLFFHNEHSPFRCLFKKELSM